MSNYRRPKVTGASAFFTVALQDRGSDLLVREVDRLREAVARTRAERPFVIEAWVVLPDHLHCIWTLPARDADYSGRWAAIKARFSMSVRRAGFSPPSDLPVVTSGQYAGLKPGLRRNKREVAIWQRRFWERHIRNDEDLRTHIRYCWLNPVRHGLVRVPSAWPYSSIHRDIRRGLVEPEWSAATPDGEFGE